MTEVSAMGPRPAEFTVWFGTKIAPVDPSSIAEAIKANFFRCYYSQLQRYVNNEPRHGFFWKLNSAVQVQAIHVFILGLSLLICKMGTVSFCHGMTVVTWNCIENAFVELSAVPLGWRILGARWVFKEPYSKCRVSGLFCLLLSCKLFLLGWSCDRTYNVFPAGLAALAQVWV